MFKRYISDSQVIPNLRSNRLFSEKILPDSRNMTVFPAIRDNRIDFYFAGSRLFEFRSDFTTHRKYIPITIDKAYLSEKQINDFQFSIDFFRDYAEIKKVSEIYSEVEANGVSYLYSKNSYFNIESQVVVLDIEIAFDSKDDIEESSDLKKRKQNRIDILLFNKVTCELLFVEAKHFSNGEIWSKKGTKPKVISQIERYINTISKKKAEILESYKRYVQNLNQLFGLNLPAPKSLFDKCGLYVFAFDSNHRDGRLSELLLKDNSLDGVGHYCLGDPKKIQAKTLWQEIVRTNF